MPTEAATVLCASMEPFKLPFVRQLVPKAILRMCQLLYMLVKLWPQMIVKFYI